TSRRRHTRFSRDWSSDVCSSDLHGQRGGPGDGHRRPGERDRLAVVDGDEPLPAGDAAPHGDTAAGGGVRLGERPPAVGVVDADRSEERRVGKGWRYRWAAWNGRE